MVRSLPITLGCPLRCQYKFCSDGEKKPCGRPADPQPSSSPRRYTRRLQIQNRSIIGPMEGSRSEPCQQAFLYYITFHQKPQTKSTQHKVTTSSPITNTTTIYSKIQCLTPVTTKKRPPAEAEVVDEMEMITASVEEVSLSENTPDEQRKSTDNDADIYYNYRKSNSKNAQIIVRVIHPGIRVTKEYTRITNNHATSAPSETKTPTKEFESTPGKEDQGLLFSPPAILPELSARKTLVYEVPKGRKAKAITSRRQKQDKEGYAASLEQERKRQ